MIATNKLRFVKRVVPAPRYGENIGERVRVLQQWWETEMVITDQSGEVTREWSEGEWRDVPIEEET